MLVQPEPERAFQQMVELSEEMGLYEQSPVPPPPGLDYPASDDGLGPDPDELSEVPDARAPRPDWIKWAMTQGADFTEIRSWTKLEIMARYGERL